MENNERELILTEGESATTIPKIGIFGHGGKSVSSTLKDAIDSMIKDNEKGKEMFDKFEDSIKIIDENPLDNIKMLMSENSRIQLLKYLDHSAPDCSLNNFQNYINNIVVIDSIPDGKIVLGVDSKPDFFDGDTLANITFDDKKLPCYGEDDEVYVHHQGKYTKKHKWKNKKKRRK